MMTYSNSQQHDYPYQVIKNPEDINKILELYIQKILQ